MCFNERKKPAVITAIFSGLILVLGLLMVVLSINFSQTKALDFGRGVETTQAGGTGEDFDFSD